MRSCDIFFQYLMLLCVFEVIIRFNGFERFSEKFETKTNMEKSHT